MAGVRWYLNNTNLNGWALVDQTAAAAATYASGWVVGTGLTNSSEFQSTGGDRASSTFVGNTVPDGTLDLTLKDAFRSQFAQTGDFAAGNWTFQFAVVSTVQSGAADGQIVFRVLKANADGSSATEITTAQQSTTVATNVAGTDINITATWAAPAWTISNQYLFVQVAWKRTGAGGMTTTNIRLRTGSSATVGTTGLTADFTPRVLAAHIPPSSRTLYDETLLFEQAVTGSSFTLDSPVNYGQSISGHTGRLTSVSLSLELVADSTPTDSIYVEVRLSTITGTLLATSTQVACATLPAVGAAAFIRFWFLEPILMASGTTYVLKPTLTRPAYAFGQSISLRATNTNPYGGGQVYLSTGSAMTGYDVGFRLYTGTSLEVTQPRLDLLVPYATAHWPLDEASGNRVDTLGGLVLAESAAIGGLTGKFDGSANFVSDSRYLTTPHSSAVQPANGQSFMIRFWVRVDSLPPAGQYANLITKQTSYTNLTFSLYFSSGNVTWWLVGESGGFQNLNLGGSIHVGEWQLVHGWYDAATQRGYLSFDGGVAYPTPVLAAGFFSADTSPLTVGGGPQFTNVFDGQIDDFVILQGRVMTAGERAADYNAGAGVRFVDWDPSFIPPKHVTTSHIASMAGVSLPTVEAEAGVLSITGAFIGGSGSETVTLVSRAVCTGATGPSTNTVEIVAQTHVSGHTLVACIQAQNGGAAVTVTDTAGNTYTADPNSPLDHGGGNWQYLFYCLNCLGHASNVVSANIGAFNYKTIAVYELASAGAIVRHAGAVGSAPVQGAGNTLQTSVPVPITQPAFVVAQSEGDGSQGSFIPFAGWTASIGDPGTGYIRDMYKWITVPEVAGAQMGGSGNWAIIATAFAAGALSASAVFPPTILAETPQTIQGAFIGGGVEAPEWTLVDSAASITNVVTINATAATVLVATASFYDANASVTDSDGNVWQSQTEVAAYAQAFVCFEPLSNSSLTVTLAGASYNSFQVASFTGPKGQLRIATGAGINNSTTVSPGTVTAKAGDLAVSGVMYENGGINPTINAGFTVLEVSPYQNGVNEGGAMAWATPDAGSLTPTWNLTGAPSTSVATLVIIQPIVTALVVVAKALGNAVASPAVDTTGATFLLAGVGGQSTPTLVDNKGNTFLYLPTYTGDFGIETRFAYCENPVVGSGHTFTTTATSGTAIVGAFSGVALSDVIGDESGAYIGSGGGAYGSRSGSPGPVTPRADDELLVSALIALADATTPTVSGFALLGHAAFESGVNLSASLAAVRQVTGAASNPTWGWWGTYQGDALQVSLKKGVATGGGGGATMYAPTVAAAVGSDQGITTLVIVSTLAVTFPSIVALPPGVQGVTAEFCASTAVLNRPTINGGLAMAAAFATAHWTLDETSGNRVDTLGGLVLSEGNGSTGSTTGKFASAADFVVANARWLETPHTAAIRPPNGVSWTLRFWVKYTTRPVSSGVHLVSKALSIFDSSFIINLSGSSGYHVLWVSNGNSSYTAIQNSVGEHDSPGVWYLIHASYDDGTRFLTLSVNASTAGNSQVALPGGTFSTNTAPLKIGRNSSLSSQWAPPMDGQIDDLVLLQNYVMSAEERTADYAGGAGIRYVDWGAPPAGDQAISGVHIASTTAVALPTIVRDSTLYVSAPFIGTIVWTRIAHAVATGTTGALDTRGATFLAICTGSDNSGPPTDSLANVWTGLVTQFGSTTSATWFVCENPLTSATHTFSATAGSGHSILVEAWHGSATSPIDHGGGLSGGAGGTNRTSLTPSAVTPTQNGELALVCASTKGNSTGYTINQGFTLIETIASVGGTPHGLAGGYLVQTTAATVNPTIAWTGTANAAARTLTLKIAQGGTGTGSTAYAPTVAEVLPDTITTTNIASTALVRVPTIQPGAVGVTTPARATTIQVFAPTIVTGPVAVTLPTRGTTLQVYAPSVAPGAVTIVGATRPITSQVFAPKLAAMTLGATIPSGNGRFAPSVALNVTTATRPLTSQVFLPSIAVGPASVTSGTRPTTAQMFVPSIGVGATSLTTLVIATALQLFTPTVVPGTVGITPAHRPTTVQVYVPSVTVGPTSVIPATISAGSQVFLPIVSLAGITNIGVGTVVSTAQLFAPTLSAGAVSVTLPQRATTLQVFAPSLAAMTLGATIPSGNGRFAPSLALTVSTAHRASTGQVFLPTVVRPAVQAITTETVASSALTRVPSVSPGAVTITLPHRGIAIAINAPSIAVGAVTVTTPGRTTTVQMFVPSVTVGATSITTAPLLTTGQLFLPIVGLAGVINVGVGTVPSTAQVRALTVTTGAVTVTLPRIASVQSIATPSLAAVVALAHRPTTILVRVPSVTVGAITIGGATRPATSQCFAPILSVGGTILGGAHLPSTAQLYPVLLIARLDGTFITSTALMFPPFVQAHQAVTGATIPSTFLLRAPSVTTVTLVGGATVTTTAQTYAPLVDRGLTVGFISTTVTLYGPEVSPDVGDIYVGGIAPQSRVFPPSLGKKFPAGTCLTSGLTTRCHVTSATLTSVLAVQASVTVRALPAWVVQATSVVSGGVRVRSRVVSQGVRSCCKEALTP